MNDLISRQAAIDLFPNDVLEWDTFYGYIAPHLARRIIEELPSAQQWIPCSERMPDERGFYLVRVKSLYRPIRVYEFDPWDLSDRRYWRSDTSGTHVFDHFVHAWMPLPEPCEVEK